MRDTFLIYGANGFVGREIARMAVEQGMKPILAGRNAAAIQALAEELGLERRVFRLEDTQALVRALGEVGAVLHCAGPYANTFRPVAQACLETGTHYLDLTGEITVYQALAELDAAAREQGVMLLPGAGFDVVATDCLAVHLWQRLPSATHLRLAFHQQGPARMPPGTANSTLVSIPTGRQVRRDGRLVLVEQEWEPRSIDFGTGPRQAMLMKWGDIFTAYYSTGIPNIEDYMVLPTAVARVLPRLYRQRGLVRYGLVRRLVRGLLPVGSTAEQRAQTVTHVWGEVQDEQGRRAAARLHGPEAGVVWTARAALQCVWRALSGDAPPGFQTPGKAYGADFALASQGVRREDLG